MSGPSLVLFAVVMLGLALILPPSEKNDIVVTSSPFDEEIQYQNGESPVAPQVEQQAHIFDLPEELLEQTTGTIIVEGRNALLSARGILEEWRFTKIEVDRRDLSESVMEMEIDLDSLRSRVFWRVPHIKSKNFLDVASFPIAKVRVTNVRPVEINLIGVGFYSGTIELELKGITNSYEFTFEITQSSPIKAHGTLRLNRLDFGLGTKPHPLDIFGMREEVVIRFSATIPTEESSNGMFNLRMPDNN
jgi:polyisoprenoid-binding protein YceI